MTLSGFLRGHNVKSGRPSGRPLKCNPRYACTRQLQRGRHCPRSAGRAIKDDYFRVPTNRAPVNLPSSPMSGA
jgi:hypothetical protein